MVTMNISKLFIILTGPQFALFCMSVTHIALVLTQLRNLIRGTIMLVISVSSKEV